MQDLADKRIIIGGGATGMGAALAVRLVKLGAKVIVGDRNAEGLQKLQPELEGQAGKAIPFVFDLSDDASIEAIVRRCVDEFGGIDGLAIPAADTSPATMAADDTVLKMDPAIWERIFRINVIGPGMLMKAAIPHMVKAGGGNIAVVSSGAAYLGMHYVPGYASSKAALNALVRHTARLCGPDKIRVNGIYPGRVVNDRKPNVPEARPEIVNMPATNALRRHAVPDEAARILCFLLSDESGWMTGQIIAANGGSEMRD